MTIDTLGYVKRREGTGMDRRLAEAQAEALGDDVAPQLATTSNRDALAVGGFLIRFLR